MLKRISSKDLRIGMHLHKLCGPYLKHPFWRTKFTIEDQETIEQILSSNIEEVVIDACKGMDVEAPSPITPEPPPQTGPSREPVSIENEMEQASQICAKAKEAVKSMFHEVRMGNALDASDALPLVEEISSSVMRNPGALISLARLKTKDDYTYMHSVAVCGLMISLARHLGLDEASTRMAGMAGLLHDVGKMAIPNEILDKPGKLTDEEFFVIKTHPSAGFAMLKDADGVADVVLDVVRHHHEKMDGSGYPDKLPGDKISLYAKMGAVCDVYDAITSNRPYKNGWDPAESLHKMAEWSKGHFDEHIFQAFIKSIGIFPVGSLVRLQSGKIGVVIDQSESLLAPIVKTFYSVKTKERIAPGIINLATTHNPDKIIATEDPAKWNFRDLTQLWSGLPQKPAHL